MPIFQDSEAAFTIVPEGDYILCVYECQCHISATEGTRGAERYDLVLNIEGTPSKVKEILIDHETCIWKMDTFLKACGIRDLKKGDNWHFERDVAEQRGWFWVNPMGLRCHAHVVQDTYTGKTGRPVTRNKVASYYTDRPALKADPELRNKPTGPTGAKAPF